MMSRSKCWFCRSGSVSAVSAVTASAAGPSPILSGLLNDNSWKPHLADEFRKPYFLKLERFIQNEWATQQVFPASSMIFRFEHFLQLMCQSVYVHSFSNDSDMADALAEMFWHAGHSTPARLMMSRLSSWARTLITMSIRPWVCSQLSLG
jgi:hypothetical protein